MVEFALVLPLLLFLAIGIMDLGRALFVYSETSNAAREAIRYATVNAVDCQGIAERARSMFSIAPSAPINVQVMLETPDDGGFEEHDWCNNDSEEELEAGQRIRITVSTSVSLLTLRLVAPLIGGTAPSELPISYTAARSIVPPEGIATGPTTTPRPLNTPIANTPTPTPTPTPQPPLPPTNFVATSACSKPNNNPVDATWTPSLTALGYKIYKLPEMTVVASVPGPNGAQGFTKVDANTSTTFYAVAYNAGGESLSSNHSTVTCGSAATNTPMPTPTNTPTWTPSPTPTDTPTPTFTPTQTPTPTPTSTPTQTPTSTPGPSPTYTPTLTPSLPLTLTWSTGYPAYKEHPSSVYVKVRLTTTNGVTVTGAIVNFVGAFNNTALTDLGTGEYGARGVKNNCFVGNSSLVWLVLTASKPGYQTATLSGWSDANRANGCP